MESGSKQIHPHQPGEWEVSSTAPELVLNGGTLNAVQRARTMEENDAGLKVVLVLRGKLTYDMGYRNAVHIEGPAFHVSVSRDPFVVRHQYDATDRLQYVAVRMPAASLTGAFDGDLAHLCGVSGSALPKRCPMVLDRRADKALQALGRQMLFCPLQGLLRDLYLRGKALELTAAVMTDIQCRSDVRLTSHDVERLHQARDIVMQRLQTPPALPELARLSGINVSKLTQGFRTLFGCSVHDYVRERRLELAYRLLSCGEISVAHAADVCGYTDSHFTKAFRRRFGILPSQLG